VQFEEHGTSGATQWRFCSHRKWKDKDTSSDKENYAPKKPNVAENMEWPPLPHHEVRGLMESQHEKRCAALTACPAKDAEGV
jgi:hypothetical protein